MQKGDRGSHVVQLQNRLQVHGFYRGGALDGIYGPMTFEAVKSFQSAKNLMVDGIAGVITMSHLETTPENLRPITTSDLTEKVKRLFSDVDPHVVEENFRYVIAALDSYNLTDLDMLCMALATIRVEVGNFQPITEYISKYNTAPGGNPYGLYDFRADLGHERKGDGNMFKGRGYIQLTGRANYERIGKIIGVNLTKNPEVALEPKIAAKILACYLKQAEIPIRNALRVNDLRAARRLVNGGYHGLEVFQQTYKRAHVLLS